MSGMLLGHIVSQEGIVVDLDKVKVVIEGPPPTNDKSLSCFMGQIRRNSRMIRYMADVATPLDATVHKTPFQWSTVEQEAYDCLKKMLT